MYHQEKSVFFGRLRPISIYLEMMKARLGGLVMLTVFCGYAVSGGEFIPSAFYSFVAIFAVVAGAGLLNCFLERESDAKMTRTQGRGIVTGEVNPRTVLVLGLGLTIVGIMYLLIMADGMTCFLTALASLSYLAAYTPMKKKSEIAVYIGAIPGALPPFMGQTLAMDGEVSFYGLFLFALLFWWQIPHFLAISLYREDDYVSAGIKIYPSKESFPRVMLIINMSTMILVGVSFLPYFFGLRTTGYFVTALCFGGMFLSLGLMGLDREENSIEAKRLWARKFFLASVLYLPVLLLALVFFP